MKFAQAMAIAMKIESNLAPFCERIQIAGSLRRQRAWVNDIDLVVLPRPGQTAALKARCLVNCTPVTDGEQNAIYRLRLRDGTEVQVDLFFARPPQVDLLAYEPGNFGTLLLCRTGSKEHNIFLVEHAKRLGLVWRPYAGVFDAAGRCCAAEEEAEIFTALDLPWIAPEHRERN
jgi:DNA polymerase (family 10)